jgi:deoxyribodipyrimidine photo-lyase
MASMVWFRQDLRIADNPALRAACEADDALLPVYIFSPHEEGAWAPGGASRVWLHHSLGALDAELRRLGSRLTLRHAADSLEELLTLCREAKVTRVFWNRRYEPLVIARDMRIKGTLEHQGIEVRTFNASLLFEPWEIRSKSGGPFQVFTPFWRTCLGEADRPEPLAAPALLKPPAHWPHSAPLPSLKLLPKLNWDQGIAGAWQPGSDGAAAALQRFLHDAYEHYATGREVPGIRGTSRLSPHLHFGEVSPRQVWHALKRFALQRGQHTSWRQSQFLTELGWREFAYHLLFHFPHTPEKPLREKFARFPWRDDEAALRAWQRGATGFPIVDAGMRQLWHTGWMHNRVRMIVGSFLVKDLLASWNLGAAWFWDTLVDADLASNTLGWQWVAGCGADAAPYFRIFNPVTQATRFDPEGTYVREWVPELARLTGPWVQQPWAAPENVLREAGVRLGTSYPQPMIDHKLARERALARLATLDKERSK